MKVSIVRTLIHLLIYYLFHECDCFRYEKRLLVQKELIEKTKRVQEDFMAQQIKNDNKKERVAGIQRAESTVSIQSRLGYYFSSF